MARRFSAGEATSGHGGFAAVAASRDERLAAAHEARPQRPSRVRRLRYTLRVPDAVQELLATEVALDKLGARGISAAEAEQIARNRHITARNPAEGSKADDRRLLMIGHTDAGRVLTLVIERTVDRTTWLIVTGWSSTAAERKILGVIRR